MEFDLGEFPVSESIKCIRTHHGRIIVPESYGPLNPVHGYKIDVLHPSLLKIKLKVRPVFL